MFVMWQRNAEWQWYLIEEKDNKNADLVDVNEKTKEME